MVKKDLKYFLSLNYPITIEKYIEYDGEEYFNAEIPDLPGCSAHGKTVEEALEKLEEAKRAWLEVSLERGLDIPEPISEQFSGKFLLRIPPKLHRQLALRAKRQNVSLNQLVRNILENSLQKEFLSAEIQEMRKEMQEVKKEVESLKTYFISLVDLISRQKSKEIKSPRIQTDVPISAFSTRRDSLYEGVSA
ncbi:MAG: toxin-antitoxin system HicB family antitoxin [Candidatus Aenigmarchaeota archaeon]|nr:toxin-antitoxin system HicB family antitoxin [Candidatus Aenigmarchaeota archaeon]